MYGYGNSMFLATHGILARTNAAVLPVNTVAPALSGTAQEGQTLTCSTGTWTGTPTITYTYQWKRNGSNIGSATNSTYTLVTADVGQSIKCTVTATNGAGSANADSNTVTPTSAVDPDAQAFITAASITNPTQQSAINTLVTDLKGYNIWTKMKALYPFVSDNRNLLSYTQDFSNAYWLKYNTSVVTNVVNAPDGTLTADELNEGTSSNYHGFKTSINGLTPNVTWGASISLKYNNRRYVSLAWYINAAPYPAFGAIIDTLNKTIVSSSNTLTASIELQSNDWFRVKLTGNIGNYTNAYTFQLSLLDDSLNEIYLGTNKSVYVWGSQIEIGTSVTSYQAITFTPQSFMAGQHKFNLKDPRDLDAAFRLTFAGGGTWANTGYTPNGSNGYADSKFVPSTHLGVNSNSLGYYSGTNLSETTSDPCNIGAFISNTQALVLAKQNTFIASRLNGSSVNYSTTTMRGFFSGSRQSSTITDIYLNGSQVGTGNSGGTLPNNKVFLGNISFDISSNPYGFGYVKNDFRFAYLSDGLDDTQMANLYTAVQAFQTTLGRQV